MSDAKPRVCVCPNCGAPIAFRAPFCGYCRAPAVWGDVPALHPGAVVEEYDLGRVALPGEHAKRTVRRADGALVTLTPDVVVDGICAAPMRNGCVAVTGICYDAFGQIGVKVRAIRVADCEVGYRAVLMPASRAFVLQRFLASAEESHADPLCCWEAVAATKPVGEPNRVELRCADSILHVLVNGTPVGTAVDARLGFGWPGWLTGSVPGGGAQVLVQRLEVRGLE